jgi:hypothetical protein
MQVTAASLSAPVLSASLTPEAGGLYNLLLTWTNPDGSAGPGLLYNFYRSTTSGGEGAKPILAGISGTGVGETLAPGEAVYYQVSAVVGSVEGSRSTELFVQAPGGVLVNVRNIHVQALKQRATDLVLSFSNSLNQGDAQNLAAYHLVTLGKLNKKTGQHATKPVKVTSAIYNATTDTVTLALKGKLPNQPLELSINTSAVLDASGQSIAGSSGQSGGTFQATFDKKGVTL